MYDFNDNPKEYILKKENYEFEGNKFSVNSIKRNKDRSMECNFKYNTNNRTYESFMLSFENANGYEEQGNEGRKLTYMNQKIETIFIVS